MGSCIREVAVETEVESEEETQLAGLGQQTLNVSPTPSFPPVTVSLFSMSTSLFLFCK